MESKTFYYDGLKEKSKQWTLHGIIIIFHLKLLNNRNSFVIIIIFVPKKCSFDRWTCLWITMLKSRKVTLSVVKSASLYYCN